MNHTCIAETCFLRDCIHADKGKLNQRREHRMLVLVRVTSPTNPEPQRGGNL